jgi:hypothetical protein
VHVLEGPLLENRVAFQDHARQLVLLAHQLGLEQQVNQVAVGVESGSAGEDHNVLGSHAVQGESETSWLADLDRVDLALGRKEERSELAVVVFLDE